MTHADNFTSASAIELLRVNAQATACVATASARRQALNSFARFLQGAPLDPGGINRRLVAEWTAWLLFQGYTAKTAIFYLKNLSSLCSGIIPSASAEIFGPVMGTLRNLPVADKESDSPSVSDTFDHLRTLVLTDCSASATRNLAKDLLLFAIYCGGLPSAQLAKLKKSDTPPLHPAAQEIAQRYSRPRNSYLFPLRQSEHTHARVTRTVEALFAEALRLATLTNCKVAGQTPALLWAAIALHCGIGPAEAASCVAEQLPEHPAVALLRAEEALDTLPETVGEIRAQVATILSSNPSAWFAMQLRARVSIDRLHHRMQENGITFADEFYPMEEIARRVGKRMIAEQRPVAPGLIFFRSRHTELTRLYSAVGDLAWGYRQTREAGSPYAVIPPTQIALYQRTIGQFTPATDLHPAGTLRLRPGDRVEVIGGDFAGYSATVAHAITRPAPASATDPAMPGRTIYRLRLLGATGIEWTADTDPRLLRPLG